MHTYLIKTFIMQFYPFGVEQGDAVLPPPIDGEGSSPMILLNEDFIFYNNIIRRAYVSRLLFCMYAVIRICMYHIYAPMYIIYG